VGFWIVIDKLVMRCSFRGPADFELKKLAIPLQATLDVDGEMFALRHAWECIPSSFTDLAFKVFDHTEHYDPFIEIKASPAKLMHGHNVYGSDDLSECALALIEVLFKGYPHLLDDLDYSTWEVVETDVTYHSWADTEHLAKEFIRALTNTSNGQTKNRTGYDSTAYFGKKNSRLKKIKVYLKLLEVMQFLQAEQRRGDPKKLIRYYPPELLDWCKGMIRWEASLKKRWFERRGIPTNLFEMVKVFDPQAYWKEALSDLFKALEGKEMKTVRDEDVRKDLWRLFPTVNKKTGKLTYGQADAAYRTYRAIKNDGWVETHSTMTKTTFYRHVEMLTECGLSRAYLQNLHQGGCEVIPFIRYATVEFRDQYPDFLKRVA
jgi:II/X family phage/plasmid replication protein